MDVNRTRNFFKALFLVLVFVLFIFWIYYGYTHPKIDVWKSNVTFLSGYRIQEDDGRILPADLETAYDYGADNTLTVYADLPDPVPDDAYLCFLTFQDVKIYYDGVPVREYNLDEDAGIPGGAVKPVYLYTPLSREDSGRELRVDFFRADEASALRARRIPEIFLGTHSDIYRLMFERYGASFILYEVLLIVSALVILGGLILHFRMKTSANVIFAGVAIALTAGWMITDSQFYPFVFHHDHIDGVLSYLICLLIPIPYLTYLSSLQEGRYRHRYFAMQTLAILNFTLWTVLHFTGIFRYSLALYYIDGALVLLMVGAALIFMREIRDGYIASYRYTAIGLIGFMICAAAEIVVILIPNITNNGNMALIGLVFLLVFAVIQQLEDVREAELERRHAMELSDAKTNFLASMSHEIRTPINSILGMNEMILRENRDPGIESYARTVQTSGRMLLSLVNDVLDFSKAEAGRLEITYDDYRLSKLLGDVSDLARERSGQKGLHYELNIGPGIPDGLYSDEFRIKQVLVNLITNAVKYTDFGSVTLHVSGAYDPEQRNIFNLCFEVTDTGRGIRDEDKARLFDAFSRSDLRKNRNIEGTGLGLAIVKSIVDSMNGTVEVESEYQKGSTFRVTLPQQVKDETTVPAVLPRRPLSDRGKKHVCDYTAPDAHVLAVDDNGPNLSIVREFLKETGVQLDLCTNGNDAFAYCKVKKYDLILLDHMMPEPDGIETLAMIRKDPESLNRDTAAVVLTANAVAGIRQQYLDAGFADYLTKPIDSKLLEETVKRFIPAEKVLPSKKEEEPTQDLSSSNMTVTEDGAMEFEAMGPEEDEGRKVKGFDRLPEIDYDDAMRHSGNDERVLTMIMTELVSDAAKRAARIRDVVEKEDFETYRIEAHSIKGLSAMVGANHLSENAKRHEFAARDGEYEFIREHYEEFLDEFEGLCVKIFRILNGVSDGNDESLS